MSLHSLIHTTLFTSATLLLLAAGTASAQAIAPEADESRSEVELRADVRDAIDRDTDVANTALVFNNPNRRGVKLACTAFGPGGTALGRRVVRIPANGLRYLRASDLANGTDFIGSALCNSRDRVAGSAIFLAPGSITNLDVIQGDAFDSNAIRFPLIATY